MLFDTEPVISNQKYNNCSECDGPDKISDIPKRLNMQETSELKVVADIQTQVFF